ncbi:insulin-like growth factor-binding protein complex acid labile subunit [Lingula anatina]|uniref:Insulin-like growth factor-binding protein complex acid labile subunit n=1 Tax=Lingula anatina TaxID=7574 RepID=A0A1S3KC64_LINAN|nr:insulin-like growth factor-binding protein complex acid labile subunit [Lingula anatina]|eukprot:XP_013420228.1 insulin-like growth factor-binding protein complex acid labile subunit [Lingula anatina]
MGQLSVATLVSWLLISIALKEINALPKGCSQLEWVDSPSVQCTEAISSADLHQIPADVTSLSITKLSDDAGFEGMTAFNRFSKLTHLEIYEGNVKEIISGAFYDMRSLDSLTLGMMHISKVVDGAFRGLSNLKRLTISQNSFEVTSSLFQDLVKLELLYLMENDIKQLPGDALRSLKQLDTLNLHGNALKDISPDVLRGLTNLKYLELATNKLTSIPAGLFQDLSQLHILTLFHNDLSNLPQNIFAGLRRLRILDLNSNKLTSIPSSMFSGLLNLAEIRLHNNSLTSLPEDAFHGAFHGLPSLMLVNLQGNQLKTLPDEIFKTLPEFSTLYVNDNQFTDLGFVQNIAKLTTLDISNNPLTKQGLLKLSNQKKLKFLTMNKIGFQLTKDIFQAFKSTSIEHWDVGDNNIGKIESETFTGFESLRELKMYRTRLTYVSPTAFKDCKSLLYVDLSENNIQYVAPDFGKLSTVVLHGNPLHCNCRLAWLKDHLNPSDIATCASPENLSGLEITSLLAENMTCWTPKVNSFSVSANGQAVCKVCGDPTPQIIIEDADGKQSTFGPSANLSYTSVVASVSLKDRAAGRYVCKALNSAPKSNGPVTLALMVSEKDIEAAGQISAGSSAATIGVYVALVVILVILVGTILFLTHGQIISKINSIRSANSNTAEMTMNNPLAERGEATGSTY